MRPVFLDSATKRQPDMLRSQFSEFVYLQLVASQSNDPRTSQRTTWFTDDSMSNKNKIKITCGHLPRKNNPNDDPTSFALLWLLLFQARAQAPFLGPGKVSVGNILALFSLPCWHFLLILGKFLCLYHVQGHSQGLGGIDKDSRPP